MKVEPEENIENFKKSEANHLNSQDLDFKIEKHSDLELKWKDISIEIKLKKKNQKGESSKSILNKVSGSMTSGNSLAILGSSGAGKTTLLNYLSRKIESNEYITSGQVTLNGTEVVSEDFSAITSYVMQDDILHSCMTPREILLFTANLKLKGKDREFIEKRVAELFKILKIEKCQSTRIGDNLVRGISGGERKRVSIAVELLSDSPILFLDEPTTGLDSYNAFETLKALNLMAKEKNKIVIFTIHQPASEIFELLSKICVLSLGKTVFCGDKDKLQDYYTRIKLPIPLNYNPFEHIIETTTLSSVEETNILEAYPHLLSIEDLQDRYKSYIDEISDVFKTTFQTEEENKFSEIKSDIKDKMIEGKASGSFCFQVGLLILRGIMLIIRDVRLLFLKIVNNLVMAVFCAILYNNTRKDSTGIRDISGLMFILTISNTMNATSSNLVICKHLNNINSQFQKTDLLF